MQNPFFRRYFKTIFLPPSKSPCPFSTPLLLLVPLNHQPRLRGQNDSWWLCYTVSCSATTPVIVFCHSPIHPCSPSIILANQCLSFLTSNNLFLHHHWSNPIIMPLTLWSSWISPFQVPCFLNYQLLYLQFTSPKYSYSKNYLTIKMTNPQMLQSVNLVTSFFSP